MPRKTTPRIEEPEKFVQCGIANCPRPATARVKISTGWINLCVGTKDNPGCYRSFWTPERLRENGNARRHVK